LKLNTVYLLQYDRNQPFLFSIQTIMIAKITMFRLFTKF